VPLRLVEGQYAPGDPICADLMTDDLASAQEFYGSLFDWEYQDVGEHLRAIKGRRMAAGFGMMEALDLAGPRWWVCLAAPNIAEIEERAARAGGSVSGAMDLQGLGRAAVLEDPQGATAVLWQPDKLEPGALGAAHGGLVWSELVTDDPTRVASYYEDLFDLTAVPVDERGQGGYPGGALTLERKELEVRRAVAGIVPSEGSGGGSARGARWRPYYQVDDLAAFLKAARSSGATVQDERGSASGRPTAILRDPQGAEFGVVQGAASKQPEDAET